MSKYLNISILNSKNNLVSNFVEDFGKINKYTYTFSIYEWNSVIFFNLSSFYWIIDFTYTKITNPNINKYLAVIKININ